MKIPVTIEFSSPGLQPPVFVSSSLNGWQPVEMECTGNKHGQYSFSKTFTAEEGEYQYKLRLGPGDWWICDDTKPRVDDGAGNENNLVIVESKSHTLYAADEREPEPEEEYRHHDSPIMKHEAFTPDHATHTNLDNHDQEHHDHDRLSAEHHVASPLFEHESIAPTPHGQAHPRDYNEHWPEDAPLLRHESVAPSSDEQNHSPLFNHESTSIDNKGDLDLHHHVSPVRHGQQRRGSLGARSGSNSSIPEEADPDDHNLEKFPTDHAGIMEHIDRVRRAGDSSEARSSSQSPSNSAIASTSPKLPIVNEGEEEEDLEDLKDGAGDKPPTHAHETVERPTAPITPPMTPSADESRDKVDSPLGIRPKAGAADEGLKQVKVQEKLDQAQAVIDQHTPVVIDRAPQAQEVTQDNVPQVVVDKAQEAHQAIQDAVPLVADEAQKAQQTIQNNLPQVVIDKAQETHQAIRAGISAVADKAQEAQQNIPGSVPVVQEKAQQAKEAVAKSGSGNKGLGLIAIGMGIVMAIGSAALAFWLIKTKSEDVVAGL
ncbi:hypothetical protein DOTSEDRAFT_70839 [Dothistroma septosporum NZE10]|uniref:AMP-activated protein kinase glycogen-binding domain-containing protein n=1 Tax=Dothistroma septosporum (strain NZE10 / CBS 128990) TaxID=675120 RepID=N1PNE5_DOTSN|nr:hypothetical protein DOTSEDRAFT_70839 [Dothistroma septosporum NZE10]